MWHTVFVGALSMDKLPARTKFMYGLGQTMERLKNQDFETFLFFYFTQVQGLSGTLAGAAVLIALLMMAAIFAQRLAPLYGPPDL